MEDDNDWYSNLKRGEENPEDHQDESGSHGGGIRDELKDRAYDKGKGALRERFGGKGPTGSGGAPTAGGGAGTGAGSGVGAGSGGAAATGSGAGAAGGAGATGAAGSGAAAGAGAAGAGTAAAGGAAAGGAAAGAGAAGGTAAAGGAAAGVGATVGTGGVAGVVMLGGLLLKSKTFRRIVIGIGVFFLLIGGFLLMTAALIPTMYADSLDELAFIQHKIETILGQQLVFSKVASSQQEQGLNSTIPQMLSLIHI